MVNYTTKEMVNRINLYAIGFMKVQEQKMKDLKIEIKAVNKDLSNNPDKYTLYHIYNNNHGYFNLYEIYSLFVDIKSYTYHILRTIKEAKKYDSKEVKETLKKIDMNKIINMKGELERIYKQEKVVRDAIELKAPWGSYLVGAKWSTFYRQKS